MAAKLETAKATARLVAIKKNADADEAFDRTVFADWISVRTLVKSVKGEAEVLKSPYPPDSDSEEEDPKDEKRLARESAVGELILQYVTRDVITASLSELGVRGAKIIASLVSLGLDVVRKSFEEMASSVAQLKQARHTLPSIGLAHAAARLAEYVEEVTDRFRYTTIDNIEFDFKQFGKSCTTFIGRGDTRKYTVYRAVYQPINSICESFKLQFNKESTVFPFDAWRSIDSQISEYVLELAATSALLGKPGSVEKWYLTMGKVVENFLGCILESMRLLMHDDQVRSLSQVKVATNAVARKASLEKKATLTLAAAAAEAAAVAGRVPCVYSMRCGSTMLKRANVFTCSGKECKKQRRDEGK